MNPNINLGLQFRIKKAYGSQANFAAVVAESEYYVSRIVNNRLTLPQERRETWAEALRCEVKDIFGD